MNSIYLSTELIVISGALRAPVTSSQGIHLDRSVLFVRVEATDGVGWGESGVLSVSHGEVALHELAFFLTHSGIARLERAVRARDGRLPDSATISMLFGTDPCSRAAAAVLEMAVADLELRAHDASLGATLLVGTASVPLGGLVQWSRSSRLDDICAETDHALALGCKRLRVKVTPGFDRVVVDAVKARAGDVSVWADCNGGYDLSDDPERGLPALRRLDEVGADCLEQPLAPTDLTGHVALREMLTTPIGLDETLKSDRAVRDALRYGAGDVFCVKPTRLGGIAATRAAISLIEASGAKVFVGGMFETGFGRATLVQLAALSNGACASDLTAPSSYSDLPDFSYPTPIDGFIAVPRGPGVAGSPVDLDAYFDTNAARVVSRKVVGSGPL